MKDYRLPDEIEKVNREFFVFSEEQGPVYEKISCSGDYDVVRAEMIQRVMDNTWRKTEKFNKLSPLMQDIIVGFLKSVCVSTYREWVEDGKKVPLDEIIETSNKLIKSGLDGFFAK